MEAAVKGYSRPELLAEPDWVWARRDDDAVRVVDCGTAAEYGRAHIPGAVSLGVDPWLKDENDAKHVLPAEAFGAVMSGLGVADGVTVVAYAAQTMLATRLWWVLNYYGHADVKVLNGGWQRWVTEGRPVAFAPSVAERRDFAPRPNERMIARLDDVRAAADDGLARILDVRPASWWRGEANPFGNKRVGHIPGAANVDSDSFTSGGDRNVFKSGDELRALLRDADILRGGEVVVHCQAGIRTTAGVFALALLGTDARAYDASMAEWANRDDTPLVVET